MESHLALHERNALAVPPAWWVICLCAQWCGVCRDYRAPFDALAAAYPQARFVWVDVEDEEDLTGDLDVETFPTLLIGEGVRARFLGPLLPQMAVLDRLLAGLQADARSGGDAAAEAHLLLQRVQAVHS